MTVTLHLGDCRDVMAGMEPDSVDSIVTDPPYGLSFMGKDWDHGVPGVAFWEAALRVAKPGAHLLAFGGSRTFHRLAVAIEDAGWEIRDTVMWVYAQGFPKSLDVSKAIDKAAGAERERSGRTTARHSQRAQNKQTMNRFSSNDHDADTGLMYETLPATPDALRWSGWGTALKPAWEPVIVARKPLEGTVAANVLAHGTGGINVDACRVGTDDVLSFGSRELGDGIKYGKCKPTTEGVQNPLGRWPANVIHDGSDEVVALFARAGVSKSPTKPVTQGGHHRHDVGLDKDDGNGRVGFGVGYGDTGSAARFFYVAKASRRDRDEGLDGLEERFAPTMGNGIGVREHDPETATPKRNHHPTVKPTALMRYLCRLVTPPGGLVFDPFMGSGSTGKAAVLEGFRFAGCDLEAEYVEIAQRRIADAQAQLPLLVEGMA